MGQSLINKARHQINALSLTLDISFDREREVASGRNGRMQRTYQSKLYTRSKIFAKNYISRYVKKKKISSELELSFFLPLICLSLKFSLPYLFLEREKERRKIFEGVRRLSHRIHTACMWELASLDLSLLHNPRIPATNPPQHVYQNQTEPNQTKHVHQNRTERFQDRVCLAPTKQQCKS